MKLIALLASCGLLCAAQPAAAQLLAGTSVPPTARTSRLSPYAGFVENKGQWPADVLFFARLGRVELTVRADALVIQPAVEIVHWDRDARPPQEPELRMPMGDSPLVLSFENEGNPTSARASHGVDEQVTRFNFLTAPLHATNVRSFASAVLEDVAPGIDVRVRFDKASFAYDLIAKPGADLEAFSLRVGGGADPRIEADGSLSLMTKVGLVEQRIGAAWQTDPSSGARTTVGAHFALGDGGAPARISFAAPGRDLTRELVIDPTLMFLTYVGGTSNENPVDIAVDAVGDTYMLAWTSAGAPVTAGAFQQTAGGGNDAWLGKLSASGSQLLFATFLGTPKTETPMGLALDPSGMPVLVGNTWSVDFPTTAGSYQPVAPPPLPPTDKSNMFVTKVAPSGDALIWSTFFGGPAHDLCSAVDVLPSGDVVVAGESYADTSVMPDPSVFDPVFTAGDKALLRFTGDGKHLVFLTYFRVSRILCLAHDSAGNVLAGGDITDAEGPLPTTAGAFQPTPPDPVPGSSPLDGFVARLSGDGHSLSACTYLGGSFDDTVWDIAADDSGAVYTAVLTHSTDFPTTSGVLYPDSSNGNAQGAVTKLLSASTGLVWSTYLASTVDGGGGSFVNRLEVDTSGNVHVVGSSNEPGYPTTPDALQQQYIGGFPKADAHYSKLDSLGQTLIYSTWIGGTGSDYVTRVALDANGRPTIAFLTWSPDLPATPGAYDPTLSGSGASDLSIARFDLGLLPWQVLGHGLQGTLGETPNLVGRGALVAGMPTRISVRGARPATIAWVVLGFAQLDLPLLGGLLVPSPDLALPFWTSSSGQLDLDFAWPMIPVGVPLWFQAWFFDPAAAQGWSASNAIRAVAQ